MCLCEKLKILMLEDNKLDAKLIKEELTEHKFDFTSELVDTEKDFITSIHNFKPDIILSDYSLPQFTGFEALEIAKKLVPTIPFIIITGSLSEEKAADSIKAGAWDYVLKENLLRLTPAIENALKLKVEKDKNRRADEEIRKLSKVVETTPEAVTITDLQGKIEYVNQGLLTLGGFEDDSSIIGKLIFLFSNEEGVKQLKEEIIPTILSKGKWRGETSVKRKDGFIFPAEMTCSLILNEENKPKHLLSQYNDITNRKKAEEKVKEHHKNIELLSKAAIQFVDFPFDKDIYTFIGEVLQEFVGKKSIIVINSINEEKDILTTRTVIGLGKLSDKVAGFLGKQPVGMTFNAKDEGLIKLYDGKLHSNQEGLYGVLLKTVPKIVCNSIEKLFNLKEIYLIGFTKEKELSGTAVIFLEKNAEKLKNKQIIETFIKQASIAIQKRQAEEALHESEKQLQTLINSMPDFVCFKDGDGCWLMANEAAIRIFQLKGLDYRGKKDYELAEFNSKLRGSFLTCKESDAKVWKEGSLIHGEETIPDSDGSIQVFDVTKVPVSYPGSERKGIVVIGHDITKRKQAEEQIKKDLKEKNALLQEIYHRTKNNMQVISSLLSMQSKRSDNEFVHNTFREIINKIKAMALVHEKLYRAKDLSHINLKEYIEDLINLLMRSYGVQSELISYNLDLKEVFVLIDSAIPCGLILNELITNIIKHAFPNNTKGEISIRLFKDDNGQINIDICDNGVGVPDDFDPKTVKTMGLQTVYALLEYQLKGKISYDLENGMKWHFRFIDDLHKRRV